MVEMRAGLRESSSYGRTLDFEFWTETTVFAVVWNGSGTKATWRLRRTGLTDSTHSLPLHFPKFDTATSCG